MVIIGIFRPETAFTFPAPVGDAEKSSFSAQIPNLRPNNPIIRYRKSDQGAEIHSHSQILAKKTTKNGQKRGFFGGFPWGGQKGPFLGGVGYPPGGVKKGGFAYQIFIVFGQKGKFGQKGPFSGILAILGVFGGFGGFEGVRKVAKNGQNRGFLGFPGGVEKGVKIDIPDDFAD